ncbi:MAG: sugar transferase [Deltaproteobacteria bacterium]|nr:sugar transferase [Deltaproteobacteria bacterium]MBF0526212.1 sugar transferase [Deltaproteobacteria bacterium]
MGYYILFKRMIDLLLAAILLLLLWPLFGLIGLAIKLDSAGPVFFAHERVGKNGRLFRMYKFRSMHLTADPYAVSPLNQEDPRITGVGKFIRRLCLDELPQLFNVLKGDMAIVGPRPEMPFIVAEYNNIHMERLRVLPGMTGLWQIHGDRSQAIHEDIGYDLDYIKRMSLFLDATILVKTMLFVLTTIKPEKKEPTHPD